MTVCAAFFDLSRSRTGWAVGSRAMARPAWGVFEVEEWKGRDEDVLADFWHLLEALHAKHTLTHIGFETLFIDAQRFQYNGTDSQFQLKAILSLFAKLNGLEIGHVANSTWFKHATGCGRVPGDTRSERRRNRKIMSIKAARLRGWDTKDDDDASDALGGLDYLLCTVDRHYGGTTDPVFLRGAVAA